MRKPIYHGAWPPLITPYNNDRTIDYPAYEQLVCWHVSCGVGGLFANCLSGDMYDLTADQAERLVGLAVEHAGQKMPVIATGSIGADPASHIEFCKRLEDLGVDAIMLLQPQFCPEEADLERYYLRIAEKTNTDLGLYEAPLPRHRLLSPELVAKLARTNRFVAYKETSGDIDTIKAKLDVCRGTRLNILQANLPILPEVQKLGGSGIMGIVVNFIPDLMVKLLNDIDVGRDIEGLWRRVCIGEALGRLGGPVAVRYMLKLRGLPVGFATRNENLSINRELGILIESAFAAVLDDPCV